MNNLKKGIITILKANLINLIFNLLISFLLPKYLSVESYAYIKSFQLFVSYIGVLAFGYPDGVYLEYGGKNIDDIDKKQIESHISTLLIFQSILSIILLSFTIFLNDNVLIIVCLSIVPLNMLGIYKLIFQAVGEYKLYSKILNSSTILIAMANLALLLLKIDESIIYNLIYVLVHFFIMLFTIFYMKKNHGISITLNFNYSELINKIKNGFALTVANFSSLLFSSLDRFFIKYLLDIYAFASYSLAISFEGFINIAITPITITLYNFFCNNNGVMVVKKTRKCLMIFSSIIISSFFVLQFAIEVYLTSYQSATFVTSILFSCQIVNVVIKGVYTNLYKADGRQNQYFITLVKSILFAIVMNVLMYTINQSKESFAIATLMSFVFWMYLCCKDYNQYDLEFKEILYIIVIIPTFIIISKIFVSYIGFTIYILFDSILVFLLFKKDLIEIIRSIRTGVL